MFTPVDVEEPESFPEPSMRLGVPKEIELRENRVAITPGAVKKLRAMGYAVQIECGAGEAARFSDADYI